MDFAFAGNGHVTSKIAGNLIIITKNDLDKRL